VQILNQILHQIVCEEAAEKGKNQAKFAVRAESCEKNSGTSSLEATRVCETQEHFRIDFQISRLPGLQAMTNERKGATMDGLP